MLITGVNVTGDKLEKFLCGRFFQILLMLLGCSLHSNNDFLLNVSFEVYTVGKLIFLQRATVSLPVSLTLVVNIKLRISPRIFVKIRNGPNGTQYRARLPLKQCMNVGLSSSLLLVRHSVHSFILSMLRLT